MNGTCERKGCTKQKQFLLSEYCSTECRNLTLQLASETMHAKHLSKEPPTMMELLERKSISNKWDSKTMKERIEFFKEAVNS